MKVTWDKSSMVHHVGKTSAVLFLIRMKTTFAYIILALKMALIKSVEKTFTVYGKSTKIAKVLSCIGFIIYGKTMLHFVFM